MKRKCLRNSIFTFVALASAFAQQPATSAHAAETNGNAVIVVASPDLRISEFVFPAHNDKAVRVRIVNGGSVASALCVLRLTVRKINGFPVGRIVEIKLPPLAPGKDTWLVIGASNILPRNVTLAATTFKLNADATSIVTESDEGNNEVWHKL
ncbi:MAG TPA: CARDB domain-containing protein [Pyrinomonadaceae bacterium]